MYFVCDLRAILRAILRARPNEHRFSLLTRSYFAQVHLRCVALMHFAILLKCILLITATASQSCSSDVGQRLRGGRQQKRRRLEADVQRTAVDFKRSLPESELALELVKRWFCRKC